MEGTPSHSCCPECPKPRPDHPGPGWLALRVHCRLPFLRRCRAFPPRLPRCVSESPLHSRSRDQEAAWPSSQPPLSTWNSCPPAPTVHLELLSPCPQHPPGAPSLLAPNVHLELLFPSPQHLPEAPVPPHPVSAWGSWSPSPQCPPGAPILPPQRPLGTPIPLPLVST